MARKFMRQSDVIEMASVYFPSFLRSRREAFRLDAWMRGRQANLHEGSDGLFETETDHVAHGRPFMPRDAEHDDEYENLQSLAPNAFAGLIVKAVAQTAHVEGLRRPGIQGTLPVWHSLRRNRWDMKQIGVHRTTVGMGHAYGLVLPGRDPLTGDKMGRILTRSPKRMAAFYDEHDDEWATLGIEGVPIYENDPLGRSTGVQKGWQVIVHDAYVTHYLICRDLMGEDPEKYDYIEYREHNIPVPPIARCVNTLDPDGNSVGEIEPVLPLLRRIDQDVFDRLINQRFGAWQVRYITGMAKPKNATDEQKARLALRLSDLLVTENPDSKVGAIPAGDLKNQIEATDADLRLLSAITQTPPHHLLGLSSNLQAEALAAAESGLQRKSFDFRTHAGEFHEQMARLLALSEGDMETARAHDLQVRWRDTESRSMTQAADALGKLAVQLKVPIEMLWERIPGWTDTDVERAKELVENGDFERLLATILENEGAGSEGGDEEAPRDGDADSE